MLTKILVSGSLLLASTAFAGERDAGATLDLEALKAKCVELASNQQLQPFKVQVTCRETAFIWREGKPASIQLPNQREVGGSIRMKSYAVPFQSGVAPIGQSPASCQVLHKWKRTVPAVDVELNCEELSAIDNLGSFCTPIIDAAVADDPSIQVFEETSETYNTCSGLR